MDVKIRKLIIYILSGLLCLLVLAGCGKKRVVEDAEELTEAISETIADEAGVDVVESKVWYVAPNDSLVVMELTADVPYYGSDKVYIAYVVTEKKENKYWVAFTEDPVKMAREIADKPLPEGIERNNDRGVRDEFIASTLRLLCSMKNVDGNGVSVKETKRKKSNKMKKSRRERKKDMKEHKKYRERSPLDEPI